jgi:hypothetical protein
MSAPGTTTEFERTSLEAHVDLCAMRYGELDHRLTSIETKVTTLQDTIEKSHLSMVKILIGTAGTIIVAVLSLLGVVITNLPHLVK